MGLTPGELLEPFTSKRLIRLGLTPGSTHDVMQSPYGSSASHEKEGSPNNSHAAQGIPPRTSTLGEPDKKDRNFYSPSLQQYKIQNQASELPIEVK